MNDKFKKVFGIVAEFLGRTDLKDDKGKITLSDQEKAKLTAEWGEPFVANFLAKVTEHEASEDTATARLAQLEAEKATLATTLAQTNAQVANLQKTVETLMKEDDPSGVTVIPPTQANRMVIGNGYKPNMNYKHNQVLRDYLSGKISEINMSTAFDVAQMTTEFGEYVTYSKNAPMIALLQPVSCMQYMTKELAVGTEWRATQASIDSVVQSFNTKWTPRGKAKFTPITIKNYKHKINVSLVPADIMRSYIAFMMYNESVTADNMPIVKYIIEYLIKPRVDEDREMKMLATGKYEVFDPAGGIVDGIEGQDPEKSMDGFVTVLEKARTESLPVNFLLTDVPNLMDPSVSDEQVVGHIEKAMQSVSHLYKRKKMFIHIDPDLHTRYKRGYRSLYKVTKNEDAGKNRPDFCIQEFAEIDGMIGTGVFFITPQENFKHLEELNKAANTIHVMLATPYEVRIYAEWWEGTGFAIAEAVFAYLPAAAPAGGGGI